MKKMKKNTVAAAVNLGFCPRCKEDIADMMTRIVDNVVFCHLCSFDIEEDSHQRRTWVQWARNYQSEMVD